MNRQNDIPEAGRAKYIIVWFLASAMVTIVTAIPDLLAPVMIEELSLHFGFHYAYAITNGCLAALSVTVMLLVYALFRNVYIQRVVPYFWLAGVLGFLVVSGSAMREIGLNYERSGLLYIDLLIQFVGVLLLFWLPSTFWPRKYHPPKGRYAANPKPVQNSNNAAPAFSFTQPLERQEPTLTRPTSAEQQPAELEPTNTAERSVTFQRKTAETDYASYTPHEKNPISIWFPTVLYAASFIFIFLKKINYNIVGFIEIAVSSDESLEVLLMEFVLGSILQPTFLFILVSLILWGIGLFGAGNSKNFRRWAHIAFAAFLTLAVLNPYN